LYVPISYFLSSAVYNDPPVNVILAASNPFGRPGTGTSDGNPVQPKKLASIPRPADQWAAFDCDKQGLNSMGITSSTYMDYIAVRPVHSGPRPALRNYLWFDLHVKARKRDDTTGRMLGN
jgi:hypothetical protein